MAFLPNKKELCRYHCKALDADGWVFTIYIGPAGVELAWFFGEIREGLRRLEKCKMRKRGKKG
jgi:hypothetical protein